MWTPSTHGRWPRRGRPTRPNRSHRCHTQWQNTTKCEPCVYYSSGSMVVFLTITCYFYRGGSRGGGVRNSRRSDGRYVTYAYERKRACLQSVTIRLRTPTVCLVRQQNRGSGGCSSAWIWHDRFISDGLGKVFLEEDRNAKIRSDLIRGTFVYPV